MPVDFFVVLIPLGFLIALFAAIVNRRVRKAAVALAGILLFVFVAIYFVPGWTLWLSARKGDAPAQYELGVYYWTRLGYMGSDVEARDFWWTEAAKRGHPRAMTQVGFFSMYGSSSYIPKDLVSARRWLEAAKLAGDSDAIDALQKLEHEEANGP